VTLTFLRSVALLPVHVFALATQAKSFRKNPVLGNRLLNRMGLHVARVVLAHAMAQLRWWMQRGLLPETERSAFHRDGFLVIEDFLPPDMFQNLEHEARAYQGQGLEQTQGDTRTHHVFLHEEKLAVLPASKTVLGQRRFRKLLRYTGSHNAMPLMFLQRIAHGFATGKPDPQKDLHTDTFHPTMKAWLFIDDVDADRGPFTYVPGSHRLSGARLRWEYRQSLAARDSGNAHTANGSFRVSQADLSAMGLGEAQAITVRRNTLVLANTHGFHCRGQARERVTRLELWAYSRKNPFLPWPGVDSPLLNRIEVDIVRRVRQSIEERSRKAGKRPIWATTTLDFRH